MDRQNKIDRLVFIETSGRVRFIEEGMLVPSSFLPLGFNLIPWQNMSDHSLDRLWSVAFKRFEQEEYVMAGAIEALEALNW